MRAWAPDGNAHKTRPVRLARKGRGRQGARARHRAAEGQGRAPADLRRARRTGICSPRTCGARWATSARTTLTRSTSIASIGSTTASARGQAATPVHVELPEALTGREGAHRRGARRAVPDDPRAQGAGRLRLPGAAPGGGPLRSDQAARGVALDRQLLPRRRRHLAHPGLPRRGRAARGHEPGAVRLAGRTGSARPRTSCARPAPSPTSRRSTTNAPSWRAIRANEIVNQFSEFGNYLAHWRCTGPALESDLRGLRAKSRDLSLPASSRPAARPARSLPATT